MYLKQGDKVVVISGADKGKEGIITKVIPAKNRVIVEGMKMATKHVKSGMASEGGRVEIEMAMDASNVMLIDPKTNKPTRVGFKEVDGKKVRYAKKSGETL